MEQLAAFLRQAGYTVWKGGTKHFSSEFLTVLKDAYPIGFILSDYSVRTTSPESQMILNGLVAFWKTNHTAPLRGQSEFLVLFWQRNEITTNFDFQTGQEIYTLYIPGKEPQQFHTLQNALQQLEQECPISCPKAETEATMQTNKKKNSKKRFGFRHKKTSANDTVSNRVTT